MKINSYSELVSVRHELDSIISELESISMGIRKDFKGIGNEKCAASVDTALSYYYSVRRMLNNAEIIPSNGAFGGGSGETR